jgi:hypothetical protein
MLAARAGAAILDVKEPDLGSLGRAPCRVWREVRQTCSASVPVSVALGELTEWLGAEPMIPRDVWSGISFRKLGLAGVPPDWEARWAEVRARPALAGGPPWIAVAYADWATAGAPHPDAVLEAARAAPEIAGVLVDTSSKTKPFRLDDAWTAWADRVHQAGLLLAMAGSLDLATIRRLDRLAPDIVAVRRAACVDGCREATIDPARVAALARCVAELPQGRAGDPLTRVYP